MTWSAFTKWFNENETRVSRATMAQIKREAVARYLERMRAGYADAPLDFSDLIHRGEDAIGGAA